MIQDQAAVKGKAGPVGFRTQHLGNLTVALVGNPNTGKTTLFNALTGLRGKTANFPGTTVEKKTGMIALGGQDVEILDLPGMYSLQATTPEERLSLSILSGALPAVPKPTAAVVIVDASNLERNLFIVSQVLALDINAVVALNMMDVAEAEGKQIDVAKLSEELDCPVIPMIASTGKGLDELYNCLEEFIEDKVAPEGHPRRKPVCACETDGCPFEARFDWSEGVASKAIHSHTVATGKTTERIDRILTHRVFGVAAFAAVMLAMFYLIFQVATVPMDLIDTFFGTLGGFFSRVLPEGDFQSLIVDGLIGGVGGILVFLPQICLLFFFLALVEDSGYLSRAALVIDKYMRRVGLPGTAFVPLLSAHACAIPAILASRVIEDERDRLVTILIAPLMSCSARIPVYVMLIALLFPTEPFKASLLFTAAYLIGISAALLVAYALKKTILKGESKPLVLELPAYRLPSLKKALMETYDRGMIFIKEAGTVILVISIGLWVMATYPKSEPPVEAVTLTQQAEAFQAAGQVDEAEQAIARADVLTSRHSLENSFAGRVGRFIEPVIRPLGYDWQIGIGIISSFAAREVIVSTLAIVYGIGEDVAESDSHTFYDTLRRAKRSDGTPVFTLATCASLLVFYILAMQCLPTQAVTKRETNTWKWPIFQIAYMTVLAYMASMATFQVLKLLGVG